MEEGASTQFTYDEVAGYLVGLIGQPIQVFVRPASRSETSVHLVGPLTAVHPVPAGRPPTTLYRCVCQIGDERGNGFWMSPHDFKSAVIDIFDPTSLAVFIRFKETDFEVVIPDDRLEAGQPLPGFAPE